MMIMSAFVAIPTYNVGADEHEEEEGCPFDWDNPDSPCNADECQDHESQECADHVESYCDEYDDPGCHEMGGEDEGPVPESFHVTAEMNTLEEWTITFGADMPTDWSDDMREDLAGMCADMLGGDSDGNWITEECFNLWTEMINSDDGGDDGDGMGCPPSLTELQCENFMSCMDENGDIICSMLEFQRNLYNICNDDDSHEFCYFDGEDGRAFFNNIFAYEDGDIGPEDLMEAIIDVYGDGTDDYTEMAAYDIQSFYIGEEDVGTYGIYPEFLSSHSPNFVCGNGEEMPFYYINDGGEDCGDGSDEQQYDDDGNETNWFDCHDGSEVWVNQVNDWEWNCPDGEDEYQEHYWGGNVYMYSGIVEDPENIDSLIGGIGYYCGWKDDDEVEIFCAYYGEADLSAGNYSILTTTYGCYDEWTDDDEDGEDDSHELECETGDYNHTVVDSDGNPVTYFAGSVDETLMMEMRSAHYDYDAGNFPLYDTYELTVGEDGFNGAITSAQWECYDWDGDGEDDECWGADLALYLYEYSFNPDDPYDNILGSNDDFYDEDFDCPADDCSQSVLQVELSEGTYVVVTAGYDSYTSGFYLNHMVDQDGDILESWDGELLASYWDTNETRVQGDDRAHLPYAYEFEEGEEGEEGNDPHWDLYMDFLDTIGSYQDGTSTPAEAADKIVELVHQADAMGLYDEGGDDEGEDYVDWNEYSYCEWVSESLDGDYDWGDDRWYCEQNASEGFVDWWYYCEEYAVEMWACTDDFFQRSDYEFSADNTHYKEGGRPDSGNGGGDNGDCPFSDDEICYEVGPYCDDGWPDMYDPEYCGAESAHYCLEDGVDDEGCAWISSGCDAGEVPPELCDAFLNFDHDAYHTDNDDSDHSRLDGIVGVEDPPNTDPDISPTNLVGALSDNEGLPMMYSGQFTLTFEGVDASLDMHEFYIPVDDGTWNVEITFLDGYGVMSCEGCEDLEIDRNNARFSADEPVTVTFGLLSDCDHIVGIDSTGYGFDPADLTINVGETVCWQWTDALDTHNVIETIGQYNSDMDLTAIDVGFYSPGSSYYYSSNTVDFRHTFTEDDMTHYYVCAPHASMGMVGRITVGEGSEVDPVKEVEESGLPSVGFIVGALVLVGAAGLRRRH
jgi:plastocyanin